MKLSVAIGEPVSAPDRAEVIDVLNRFNMAFDVWDLETMFALKTEDFSVHHPRGVASGLEQLTAFYKAYYPLTVGVRRQHLNHVVTGNTDGTITINSYNLLIRVATEKLLDGQRNEQVDHRQRVIDGEPGLPAIIMHSIMIDKFRRDPGHGWRLAERWVEETVVNRQFA
jgi:hypothetical protein